MEERRMNARYVHDCWRTITRPTGTWTRCQMMTWWIWYDWFLNHTGHGEEKLSSTSESRRSLSKYDYDPRLSRRRVKWYLRTCDLFLNFLCVWQHLHLWFFLLLWSLLYWVYRVTDGCGESAHSCTNGACLKVHEGMHMYFQLWPMLVIRASWKERTHHRTISRLIHDILFYLTTKFLQGPRRRKSWGPEGWEPKKFALFFPLPLPFSFFFSLSGGSFSWNFGGVWSSGTPQMCTFGCRVKPRRPQQEKN